MSTWGSGGGGVARLNAGLLALIRRPGGGAGPGSVEGAGDECPLVAGLGRSGGLRRGFLGQPGRLFTEGFDLIAELADLVELLAERARPARGAARRSPSNIINIV